MNFRERKEYYQNFDLPTFLMNPKVADFVGKDFGRFQEIWINDYKKTGHNVARMGLRYHWTWLGFILGPVVWYSHRKMYLMALGIIGIYMLVTFFEEYFNLGLGSVSFAATNIILALMAKSTYLQHIIDFFHRNREISGQQLDDLIASNGGTSKIAAFLFFAFSIMAIILASITGDIVAGHEISFLTSDQTTSIVTQRQ
jgi:hypothetical protein